MCTSDVLLAFYCNVFFSLCVLVWFYATFRHRCELNLSQFFPAGVHWKQRRGGAGWEMEARSCAQQLSRQEGGSGIFNFEKSGEGHGAGAFELGGWGCVPECYISPPATLHAWPVQKADWNVGQTPPPTSLFLYLSLSLFVTNITARRRFGKQRECVTLVLSLCFGSLNHTKKD